jgi:hypothetical protein
MTKVSVLLEEFDYVIYQGDDHELFYDIEENTFAEIDGDNIQSCLEYHADLECIAIYECGYAIYKDLESHSCLQEFIDNDKFFSGIVMAPLNNEKINYGQLNDINIAFNSLCQSSSSYAVKLDQIDRKTILTMYCGGSCSRIT